MSVPLLLLIKSVSSPRFSGLNEIVFAHAGTTRDATRMSRTIKYDNFFMLRLLDRKLSKKRELGFSAQLVVQMSVQVSLEETSGEAVDHSHNCPKYPENYAYDGECDQDGQDPHNEGDDTWEYPCQVSNKGRQVCGVDYIGIYDGDHVDYAPVQGRSVRSLPRG
jgi:hypothetical protein